MYPSPEHQTASTARMEMLVECFNAGKNFLETVVTVPVEEMVNWTFSEWMCLSYAVVISRRSAIILNSVYHSDDSKWRGLWMDECCDTLSARAKSIQTLSGPHPNKYFDKFIAEWSSAKLRCNPDIQIGSASRSADTSNTQQVAAYLDSLDEINMESMSWYNFGFDGISEGDVML